MSVLTHANRQWESRPADERFPSIQTMHEAALDFHNNGAEADVDLRSLEVIADGQNLSIVGPSGTAATLNNRSFGQIARHADAPAHYLATLPTKIAAECLSHGLSKVDVDSKAKLLLDRRGTALTTRAVTSTAYSRIWNCEVTARLLQLEAEGPWQPAPAAFDGSRGLYLGDRDMFAFMVDNERRIFEKGPGGGLSRGFFVWNGETGERSIGCATFLYEYVCGNHRVWGVEDVKEIRIAHIGTDDERAWGKLAVELKRYAETTAGDEEARVEACMNYEIAATKEETINAVFALCRASAFPRKLVVEACDLAEQRVDWYGSPRSAWGMAGALTEIARDRPNADERVALDRAAGKVMQMAF